MNAEDSDSAQGDIFWICLMSRKYRYRIIAEFWVCACRQKKAFFETIENADADIFLNYT